MNHAPSQALLRAPRVPLKNIPVSMSPEHLDAHYRGDGLNISTGGLSLRSSDVLPEVGSRMCCEFLDPDQGGLIKAFAEVVWVHEVGSVRSEFGVRFLEVADEDHKRIQALVDAWDGSSEQAQPGTVHLELDAVQVPIVAEAIRAQGDLLELESSLPFLKIGAAVRDATHDRQGTLEAVDVRIEGETPRLVLYLRYDDAALAAEQTFAEADPSDTLKDPLPDSLAEDINTGAAKEGQAEFEFGDESNWLDLRTVTGGLSEAGHVALRGWGLSKEALSACRDYLTAKFATLPREGGVQVRGAWSYLKHLLLLVKTRLQRFSVLLISNLRNKPRRRTVALKEVGSQRAGAGSTRLKIRLGLLGAVLCAVGVFYYVNTEENAAPIAELEASKEVAVAQETESSPASVATTVANSPSDIDEVSTVLDETSFGATLVPLAERYVLKMNNPVKRLHGLREQGGFSVKIPGALSLTRAGPIAEVHPLVQHAAIWNHGSYSELTIRFKDQTSPSYRVQAVGSMLEVVISREPLSAENRGSSAQIDEYAAL